LFRVFIENSKKIKNGGRAVYKCLFSWRKNAWKWVTITRILY